MNRDIFIRNLTKEKIEMSPKGRNADELTVEEFEKDYERKYEKILIIHLFLPRMTSMDIFGITSESIFKDNARKCG